MHKLTLSRLPKCAVLNATASAFLGPKSTKIVEAWMGCAGNPAGGTDVVHPHPLHARLDFRALLALALYSKRCLLPKRLHWFVRIVWSTVGKRIKRSNWGDDQFICAQRRNNHPASVSHCDSCASCLSSNGSSMGTRTTGHTSVNAIERPVWKRFIAVPSWTFQVC